MIKNRCQLVVEAMKVYSYLNQVILEIPETYKIQQILNIFKLLLIPEVLDKDIKSKKITKTWKVNKMVKILNNMEIKMKVKHSRNEWKIYNIKSVLKVKLCCRWNLINHRPNYHRVLKLFQGIKELVFSPIKLNHLGLDNIIQIKK